MKVSVKISHASLGGGGQGRVPWRDAAADYTHPEAYGTRADPYGWQVAVAVAVAAIVLANYRDISSLLRRAAFTVGACACACVRACACLCARDRVRAGSQSQVARSHRAPCHI